MENTKEIEEKTCNFFSTRGFKIKITKTSFWGDNPRYLVIDVDILNRSEGATADVIYDKELDSFRNDTYWFPKSTSNDIGMSSFAYEDRD